MAGLAGLPKLRLRNERKGIGMEDDVRQLVHKRSATNLKHSAAMAACICMAFIVRFGVGAGPGSGGSGQDGPQSGRHVGGADSQI